jgi:HEPN superfamily Swt1-like protein
VDVTQALGDAENTLRDFIGAVLWRKLGPGWLDTCGVSADRLAKWRERKDQEAQRQEAGVVEERLIYYADFYDLKTILKKHWSGEFSEALGDWRTCEVWLTELERLRDPEAHRRELLPHQKHLAIGVSGEIRNRIVRYRSRKETTDDCFPRIESARDSLGNIWVPEGVARGLNVLNTGKTLRPGDSLEYVVTARDPEDLPLEYCIAVNELRPTSQWQSIGAFSVRITQQHIQRTLGIELYIRSPRTFHASDGFDDRVTFLYTVLPARDR